MSSARVDERRGLGRMASFLGASVATLLVWATVGVNARARWVPAESLAYRERERSGIGAES
ncbi:MAG TPA: hypothetical protein VKM54_23390 [Myxococcota bacterium]|nr:hypothetical protein [Myxococcota bacterium]